MVKKVEIKKENNNFLIFILIISALTFIIAVSAALTADHNNAVNQVRQSCSKNKQIYVEESNTCRDKTISEKFDEKCSKEIYGTMPIRIGHVTTTCSKIKELGLERAFVENKLVSHGDSLYEKGTLAEITAGKNVGDYCLSASDTWNHIGETRCVVFTPGYFSRQGNNYFLDEKEDYQNGFVVYMYGNYGWDWFINTYKDKGAILVCGVITTYQGHPQIKTTPSETMLSPKGTTNGNYTVYQYSCK